MVRFVLVHGAWLGAWCWDDVIIELRAAGHEAVALDLPGHGDDQTAVAAITLASYADAVMRSMSQPAVLVGHSMAGAVISTVAEKVPELVASAIYVAAYLLRSGESIAAVSSVAHDSLVGPNMMAATDWSTISIRPQAVQAVFAADAPESALKRLTARFRPEPAAPFNTPIEISSGRFGKVPRFYVRTAQDRAVTPDMQESMLAKVPCNRAVTLNTSHTPFFSAPSELARVLVGLASGAKEVTA